MTHAANTRALANQLRNEPALTALMGAAAAAIDALLDIIEMHRGPHVANNLGCATTETLRPLRMWHAVMRDQARDMATRMLHERAVQDLNRYFPKGDQQ
jgi:hypothetical protein